MKATIIRPEPVPLPPPTIQLELSVVEARAIHLLLYNTLLPGSAQTNMCLALQDIPEIRAGLLHRAETARLRAIDLTRVDFTK